VIKIDYYRMSDIIVERLGTVVSVPPIPLTRGFRVKPGMTARARGFRVEPGMTTMAREFRVKPGMTARARGLRELRGEAESWERSDSHPMR
jgi:hypothetical protein